MLKFTASGLVAGLCLLGRMAAAAAGDDAALAIVKNQPCRDGESVAQYLDHKAPSSLRDGGWRVFATEEGFDVERVFLASKSMEIRYRWRVDGAGVAQPVGDRAQGLCG